MSVLEDGVLEVLVSVTWKNYPDAPEVLAKAVAETVSKVFGGVGAVQEFRDLNRKTNSVH